MTQNVLKEEEKDAVWDLLFTLLLQEEAVRTSRAHRKHAKRAGMLSAPPRREDESEHKAGLRHQRPSENRPSEDGPTSPMSSGSHG